MIILYDLTFKLSFIFAGYGFYMKTQKQRMINGKLYMGDEELRQDMYEARRKIQDFNKIIIIPKRVRQSFALFFDKYLQNDIIYFLKNNSLRVSIFYFNEYNLAIPTYKGSPGTKLSVKLKLFLLLNKNFLQIFFIKIP